MSTVPERPPIGDMPAVAVNDGPVILPPPPPGETPGPGVYRDVPAEAYHAWPYASAGLLGELDRSPLSARYALSNPSPDTPAFRLGRAFHALTLEPRTWAERYVAAGPCSAVLGSGDRAGERCGSSASLRSGGEWLCGQHAKRKPADPPDGREVVRPEDVKAITDMAAAVRSHGWARRALAMAAEAELTVVWDERVPVAGGIEVIVVRCKIRADWMTLAAGWQFCLDLKSTENGTREAFRRDVAKYAYHRRAAFYLRGLNAAGFRARGYVLLTVEKSPPHVVRAYRVDDADLATGDAAVSRLLATYARCLAADDWAADDADLQTIELPGWARDRPARD